MIELHLILILMIIGAIVAIEIEDLLSSVIALGAVGFGLTLGFLLLKAPDLAITQLVVEILSLIILISATVKRDIERQRTKTSIFYYLFAVIFISAFLFVGYRAILNLPSFGKSLMKIGSEYVAKALEKTKSANIVTAVILDFRGYDTLGEATVLFASVVAVLSVLRRGGKKKDAFKK